MGTELMFDAAGNHLPSRRLVCHHSEAAASHRLDQVSKVLRAALVEKGGTGGGV
jgi:hypothetical protein